MPESPQYSPIKYEDRHFDNGTDAQNAFVRQPGDFQPIYDKSTQQMNAGMRQEAKDRIDPFDISSVTEVVGTVHQDSPDNDKRTLLDQSEVLAKYQDELFEAATFSESPLVSLETRARLKDLIKNFVGGYQELKNTIADLKADPRTRNVIAERTQKAEQKYAAEHFDAEKLHADAERYVQAFFAGEGVGSLPPTPRLRLGSQGEIEARNYSFKPHEKDRALDEEKMVTSQNRIGSVGFSAESALSRYFKDLEVMQKAVEPLCVQAVEDLLRNQQGDKDPRVTQSNIEITILDVMGNLLWSMSKIAEDDNVLYRPLEASPDVSGYILGVLDKRSKPNAKADVMNLQKNAYLPSELKSIPPEQRQAILERANVVLKNTGKPPLTEQDWDGLFCEQNTALVAIWERLLLPDGSLNLQKVQEQVITNLHLDQDLKNPSSGVQYNLQKLQEFDTYKQTEQTNEKRKALNDALRAKQAEADGLMQKYKVTSLDGIKKGFLGRGATDEDITRRDQLEQELQDLRTKRDDLGEFQTQSFALQSQYRDKTREDYTKPILSGLDRIKNGSISLDVIPKDSRSFAMPTELRFDRRKLIPETIDLEPYDTLVARVEAQIQANIEAFVGSLQQELMETIRRFSGKPEAMKAALQQLGVKDENMDQAVMGFLSGRLFPNDSSEYSYPQRPKVDFMAAGQLSKKQESDPTFSIDRVNGVPFEIQQTVKANLLPALT